MILEINAAIQGLRGASELLKVADSIRNANEINTAIAEALSKLIVAHNGVLAVQEKLSLLQEEKTALAQSKRELEQKIVALENWNREAERYQFSHIVGGIPAYVIKPGMEQGNAPQELCANCFDSRQKKSHLQHWPHGAYGRVTCSQCKGEWFPNPNPRPQRLPELEENPRDPNDPKGWY